MAEIVFGAIMPHPPILIPEIGKGRLKEAAQTKKGLEEIAGRIKKLDFETVIVITPHGNVGMSSVPVYSGHVFEGNFGQFGAPNVKFSFKGDPPLGLAVVKACEFASSCPETILDHGALVPLAYLSAGGNKKNILPIAIGLLPLRKLFEFGQRLARTLKLLKRRVVVIASADMSHRLTPDAPSGFSPRGKEFDEKLVELVRAYDVNGILDFDPALAQDGGQDALWSIAILLGALDGLPVKQEVLSYEGPFGVGYLTAAFETGK